MTPDDRCHEHQTIKLTSPSNFPAIRYYVRHTNSCLSTHDIIILLKCPPLLLLADVCTLLATYVHHELYNSADIYLGEIARFLNVAIRHNTAAFPY